MKISSNIKIISTLTALLLLIIILSVLLEKTLALILVLLIIIMSLIALFKTKKLLLNDIKIEIKSITWPNKKELVQSMITINVIILAASLLIWLIDSILTFFISKII